MSDEDIKLGLQNATKRVQNIRNVFFCIVGPVSFMIILFVCYHARTTNNFNSPQSSEFIDCTYSSAEAVGNSDIVDIAVAMENPYGTDGTFVGKLPAGKDENLVLIGRKLMWHGRYNLKDNRTVSPVFYFQDGKVLDNTTRRHYYVFRCSILDSQLDEIRSKRKQDLLQGLNAIPSVEKDLFYSPQQFDKITCEGISVQYTIEYYTIVDVVLVFKHPYQKEGVTIDKFPMRNDEKLVMTGREVYWYSSFYMFNHERFEKTLVSFEKTLSNGTIRRHYYKLSCPMLDKELEAISGVWLTYQAMFAVILLIGCFLYMIISGFAGGLLCGEVLTYSAIKAVLKTPEKVAFA